MELVRSKQRVADHGEVFTPPWMVEAMLDLVKELDGEMCRSVISSIKAVAGS